MESIIVDDITILFDVNEKPSADLLAKACTESIPVIFALWRLKVPPKCKVYVMTSWQKFLFQSAPWYRKILIFLLFPLLYVQTNKQWSKIAGWTLMGQPIIGIKAPALLDLQDKEIGKRIYLQESDLNKRVQEYLCHELVHVCANHLKLPLWLNEGIAMYTVDKLSGKQTVQMDTLKLLNNKPQKYRFLNYRTLANASTDEIVYNYVRGYWMTWYLEKNYPGFMSQLLQRRYDEQELVKHISDRLSVRPDEFWSRIDHKIVAEFAT